MNVIFRGTNLRKSVFDECEIEGVGFIEGVDLREAEFSDIEANQLDFGDSDLRNATFTNITENANILGEGKEGSIQMLESEGAEGN